MGGGGIFHLTQAEVGIGPRHGHVLEEVRRAGLTVVSHRVVRTVVADPLAERGVERTRHGMVVAIALCAQNKQGNEKSTL